MQNKTPRGQQRSGRNQSQGQTRHTKKEFETHWTKEKVGDAIKRGQVFVGPIRINPKNYKDAYVPQPDGTADVYICGTEDRNRVLNTDVVVVEPYPLQQWRVNLEAFDLYQAMSPASDKVAAAVDGNDCYDSGPDVEIESESDEDNTAVKDVQKAVDGLDLNQQHPASKVEKVEKAMKNLQKLKGGTGGKSKSSKVLTHLSSEHIKFMTVAETRLQARHNPLAMDLFGEKLKDVVTPFSVGKSLAAKFLQVTGKVVAIYENKHSRAASGHIKPMADNKSRALFAPMDSRIPRIILPINTCPQGFLERPKDFENTLFIARIQQWDDTSKMPWGVIARSIGEAGLIEPETEALLLEMDVDDSPFSQQVIECLPQNLPWVIPQEEFQYRRDLRRSCIFTIDPTTARDLDDALSIEDNGDGTFEVGVHIADVSFFIQEGTELDAVAAKRATSVYLVQKVVPMLPRLLCEELCSLNPDEDRLSFSVIWTINEVGEILEEWFGRTVIRSCVKLSYDHAQGFLDEPEKDWRQEELPPITNSFRIEDIKKRVLQLNKLAVLLRQRRYDSGALRLDQVKIQYCLDKETGLPNGYSVYKQRDSNRLIEEYMLLANMAVAHHIKKQYPDKAILRRHPTPQDKPLQQVSDVCESLGLSINCATAGTLHESLKKYSGHDEVSIARVQVLVTLLSKPMQNAKYFCSGVFQDEAMYHHYALNVPLYTHFTSPIRRYADVMVHRLLAASLDYSKVTSLTTPILNRQADHCNDKKLNAKMASERSSDMFFSVFVKECGPLEEKGMVMAVLDKSFDVLILKLGVVKRVYLEKLPLMDASFRKNQKSPELHIVWAADESCDHRTSHVIRLFTMVDCKVYADTRPLQYSCVIYRPKDEIRFHNSEAS